MPKSLFEKLQWKPTMARVLLLRAPDTFDPYREGLDVEVETTTALRAKGPYSFALTFVLSRDQISELAPKIASRLADDGVLWFAYPKKSSPHLKSDIQRGSGWEPLGALGFEGVRQVSVDEDWSALRFRRVENIRTMTRAAKNTLSAAGRKRASKRSATPKTARSAGGTRDLAAVFGRLRQVVAPHIKGLPNLEQTSDSISVDSRDTAPNGQPLQFLSIVTRTKSVNLYLMPIYVNPELAEALPPGLAKRRQGKSCFNFSSIDEPRFSELSALIRACRKRWAADGRL